MGEMSCCGVVCSECESYPEICKGCNEIKGTAFWNEYIGEETCSIYNCCINEKGYQDCGTCENLPCAHYEGEDPTKSKEENHRIFKKQMLLLRHREDVTIRPIKVAEYPQLEEILYNAIYQKEGEDPLPHDVIYEPEINVYIMDFGEPSDICFVAELKGNIIGAVWSRILAGDVKGFGNIDPVTPELGISLKREYRNCGIGTRLMEEILSCLKEKGYDRVSLSVAKHNKAQSMYQKLGFKIISENEEDYIMVHQFQ